MLSASLSRIKISLRWILVIPFVLQTLGAVGLVGYLSYRSGEQAVENLANQLVGELSHCIQDHLDTYLQTQRQVVEQGSLSVFLNKLHFSDSGKVLIIERSGDLVATSTDITQVNAQLLRVPAVQSRDLQIRSLAQKLLKKYGSFRYIQTTTILDLNINQQRQFVQITPYSDRNRVDWLVITSVPAANFITAIEANKTQTFILCCLTLLTTTIISIFTANWISKPILNLSYANQALARREWQPPLAENIAIAEIQQLTQYFNQTATDLKQAFERAELALDESALQKSEAALRAAQEVAHIGSWEFDVSTETTMWSEELYHIHQRDINQSPPSPEELRNQIIHPDYHLAYQSYVEELYQGEQSERDFQIILPDGSVRYVVAKGKPIFDHQGKLVRIVGTVLDITERKRIATALQQSQAQLQNLADASPAVMYTVVEYPSGPVRYEYLSPAFEAIHEISVGEALKNPSIIVNQIHPEDVLGYQQAVAQSIEKMQPFKHEWRIITPAGKIKWIQANSRPQRRENGEIAWHGVVQEISDRKQLELALQASQAKLNDILNSASASITSMRVFIDGSWDINHVSAGCEVISGYTAEELRNDKYLWVSRIAPEDSEKYSVFFDNIFAGRTATYEYRLYHKNGTVRWISETLNSHWDAAENCWFVTGISSDISDRKRSEAERQQIDQMKNEFISVVSHELRTPLTAIHGALGMLASGVFDKRPHRGQEMLTIAWNNCDRLVRLVNDILDLERLESGKTELVMESCQVDMLMQQAIDAVQAIALQASIILEVTPLSVTITAAPDAIVQTLINLLSNAIKFSPSDSKIWLTADIQKEIGEQERAYILFTVKDKGRGIPDDKLEKIFGRFQQVDVSDARQKGGTGLGLAICKSIVEQHSGQIWVESVFGKGSSFYFTLPVKI